MEHFKKQAILPLEMDTDIIWPETLDQAVKRIKMLEEDTRKDLPAVPDAPHFPTMQAAYYPDFIEAERKRLSIIRQRKAAIRELRRDYWRNHSEAVRFAAGKALGYSSLRIFLHEARYALTDNTIVSAVLENVL
jgi:hypothetical protein